LVTVASHPASAQFVCTVTPTDSTCINSGAAAGTSNTAGGPNQNATTTNSGASSGGFFAQTLSGGNATATNSGANSGGFFAQTISGGNATATNSGANSGNFFAQTIGGGSATATNSGANSGGFFAQTISGGNATATNSGGNSGGFFAQAIGAGNATATNSGTNSGGFFVQTFGAGNATATNSGGNSGGFFAQAIGAGNATATNSGTNSGGFFVQTFGVGNATATNSGSTTGTIVLGAFGVGTSTLTNSGLISNFGGTAISFSGGPDTLNLLPGSTIIGGINLVGVNDTVNFRTGNQNLTFNTLAGATVTSNVPFAVSGNRVATVDPTSFAMTDRNLMDFTRSVSSAIPMIDGRPASMSAMAFAGGDDGANKRIADVFANIPGMSAYASDTAVYKSPTVTYGDGTVLWARGFAGQRVQPADDPLLHTLNQFYGGMIGADWRARADLRLGGFVGGGQTRSSVDLNMGDTKSDLIFGGVYARYFWGNSFLQGMVQAGHSRTDTSRNNINNNLLPNGLETATASYDGWYISPEATYGLHYGLGTWAGASYTLTPSLQLRYLYASFDGYTESGTTAPLTLGTRTLGDFEERGQLKFTRTQVFTPTEAIMANIYGGVLGVQRVGSNTVPAVLLGQAIPFATPGDDNVWGGFGGAGIEVRTGNVAMFISGEYLVFSDSSTVVSGKGGIRIAF
jgi:hypothetical protein